MANESAPRGNPRHCQPGAALYGAGMLFETLTEIADPEPHGAALNMALDEVLLRGAAVPMLRIYRWAQPAVSFGYFGKFAEVEAAWPEREPVRRWTGGGIVPHGEDLTYTLIVPRAHPFAQRSARDSYRVIHEGVAALLRRAGLTVSVAAQAHEKRSAACFENPAESDVLTATGKIAGAAQRRTQWGLLHQGSIQLSPLPDELRARLASQWASARTVRELTVAELAAAETLAAQKYATEAWLRRA